MQEFEIEPKWTFKKILTELALITIAKSDPDEAEVYFNQIESAYGNQPDLDKLIGQILSYGEYLADHNSEHLITETVKLLESHSDINITVYLTNRWKQAEIHWPV